MPLKNRQMQIPGGLKFLQPETGWHPRRFSSFDSIVQQVIAHRLGNRHLIAKNGHSVDPAVVANEVDNYNTKICLQQGWGQYVEGGQALAVPFRQRGRGVLPPPPPPKAFAQSLGNVAGGSRAIVDFVANRQEAVPDEVAITRAQICAVCPQNQSGGWLARFTRPVAEAIRRRLEQRRKMNLSTPVDEKLGVCNACDCPIPLMIHFPLETKLKHMSERSKASLHADCWVLKESASKL